MPDAADALFRRHFGHPPVHRLRAPLGLVLIGQHAEACDGLALTLAINRGTHFASTGRTDGCIELCCEGRPERERFWLDDLRPNPAQPWADSFKAVLGLLQQRGARFTGFTGAIAFDPPLGPEGAGLVPTRLATVLSLRRLHPFELSPSGNARSSGRVAEPKPLTPTEKWQIAGLCAQPASAEVPRAGLLAAVASLAGKAWQVASLDLSSQSLEYTPVTGAVIVLCRVAGPTDSTPGVATASETNEVHALARLAAGKLGVRSLRTVELKLLEAGQARLSPVEFDVVRHLVRENARVVAAERALRENDLATFGQYVFQSYEGSRSLLGNVPTELDLLIELARAQPGFLGAATAPAGLGAATINLVAHHQSPGFMKRVSEGFQRRTGVSLAVDLCQTVDSGG